MIGRRGRGVAWEQRLARRRHPWLRLAGAGLAALLAVAVAAAFVPVIALVVTVAFWVISAAWVAALARLGWRWAAPRLPMLTGVLVIYVVPVAARWRRRALMHWRVVVVWAGSWVARRARRPRWRSGPAALPAGPRALQTGTRRPGPRSEQRERL